MRRFAFIAALPLLVSCTESQSTIEPEDPPELDVLQRVYEGPKWPDDVVPDPAISSVSYLGFNGDSGRWIPCMATPTEAESLAVEAGFWITGGPRETALFFEFDNGRPSYGHPIVRVYRSSYLEALTINGLFDIDWPGGGIASIGPIAERPLTTAVVLDLIDRIWIQWNHNVWGATLLSQQLEDRDTEILVTTHEATILGGDWGICDRVSQMVTTYRVEKPTGVVSVVRFVLPEMEGRCPYGPPN